MTLRIVFAKSAVTSWNAMVGSRPWKAATSYVLAIGLSQELRARGTPASPISSNKRTNWPSNRNMPKRVTALNCTDTGDGPKTGGNDYGLAFTATVDALLQP